MADKTCKVCGRVIPDGHICLSCGDYDDMQTFNQQPKTNGGRIRASAGEELTRYLGCRCCAYLGEPKCDTLDCTEGKLQRLGSEVRNE